MPNAVIIGGRGQTGRAIAGRLVEAGWSVTATTKGDLTDLTSTPGIRWLQLDRDQTAELSTVVGAATDLVVDVIAFNPRHGRQLLELKDRIGSAIVISTVSVYSDAQGRSLDEATDEAGFPHWPNPISETWQTLPAGDTNYSNRKVTIEETLRDGATFPVTIIRPGAILGPHGTHLREWYFIKRVLDQRRPVVLPYLGRSIFQPTSVQNLAQLVFLAAQRPASRTLNCGDLNPPSVLQISEIVDRLMGHQTERVLVEGPEPLPSVGNNPWAVPRPVVVNMDRAKAELEYQEVVTYQDALSTTLKWALAETAIRDWREVFPTMAAYPEDPFDYSAEDSFLANRPR
ncbi:MAG: NAD-dependent epimerase/dehydratase family protein [Candidatus Dormibacteria bacterium]